MRLRYTDMLRSEPRGVLPGAGGGWTGEGGVGVGAGPGWLMRIGGTPRLEEPIGAAKAEREVAAIMSMRIINIS